MRVRSKTCVSVLAVAALLFLLSCARGLKETRLTTEYPEFTMIIASDSSEFKDSIRRRIISKYSEYGNVEVVNMNKLKSIRPEDYDVILIIDTCMSWGGLNWSLKSFLDKSIDRKNVVLFMTSADPEWEFSYKDVDAITSASKIQDEETIFAVISSEIDIILAKE